MRTLPAGAYLTQYANPASQRIEMREAQQLQDVESAYRTHYRALSGKTVRLRFLLRDADLYSLRFR